MAIKHGDPISMLLCSDTYPVFAEVLLTHQDGTPVARHVISLATLGDLAEFIQVLSPYLPRSTLLDMSQKNSHETTTRD